MNHSVVSFQARTASRSTHFSTQFTTAADFRIQKKAERIWEISALSDRALKWLNTEYRPDSPVRNDAFRTCLTGANRFMRNARDEGYRIEYVGPLSVSYF
ncbi:conserved hypothetical protein (plasmid) [Sinorhizobium fredii NGR234]|uniref:Uncharacterized protein n=1 Tax=Sinorhizobium fredii (strain NBRC 101917 / NGR234) TaxID=394 RepID=Q6W1C9_SINFN|nr:hypothetical protein [Sinorhizobium fredii]AAQ87439.1 Hypothetical protein RNGR00313 [Sinorhizobium fredii NGR234]ACP21977.1 conserved hypothetical protein [Sinorhizobium fredii NGR234]